MDQILGLDKYTSMLKRLKIPSEIIEVAKRYPERARIELLGDPSNDLIVLIVLDYDVYTLTYNDIDHMIDRLLEDLLGIIGISADCYVFFGNI